MLTAKNWNLQIQPFLGSGLIQLRVFIHTNVRAVSSTRNRASS
jgi:hypothetical protein